MWPARTPAAEAIGPERPDREPRADRAIILGIAVAMRDGPQAGAIDLDLLTRQTLGDRELEAELFALFEGQVERLMPVIAGSPDRVARSEAAHSLRGASSAIAAVQVMRIAGELEVAFATEAETEALVSCLKAAVADVRAAIAATAPTGRATLTSG